MTERIAFVTGAGGCVGRRVMGRLLDDGWRVAALLMAGELESFAFADDPRVEVVTGDLRRLEAAMIPPGATVIHLAAHVHTVPTNEAQRRVFFEINTGATAELARLAVEREASGFVFISSLAVYGPGGARAFAENDPLEPATAYGQSKRDAEIRLAEILGGQAGVSRVILRPAVVYGPGDRGNFLRLIRSVAKGSFPVIDGGRALKTTLYVDNLARTIAFFAANAARFDGRVFNVADPEPSSLRAIAETTARVAGVEVKIRNLPAGLLWPAALIGDALGWLARREMPLSRRKLRVMTTDTLVDTTALREAIGDEVAFLTLEEGLRDYLSGDSSPLT